MKKEILNFIIGTYFPGLLVLLFCYLLGTLIFDKSIRKKYVMPESQITFINTLFGLLLMVIIYASYLTFFKTIFVISAILLLFIFIHLKVWKFSNWNFSNFELFPILFLVFAYTLAYLLLFWKSFSLEYFPYFSIGRDDIFYSQVAYHIKQFGVENPVLASSNESYKFGIIPYHYFEGYVTLIVRSISNCLIVQLLNFSTFPIFVSILSFGLLNVKKYSVKTFLYLSFTVLFIIFFYYYNFKNLPYFIFAALSLRLYFSSYYKESLFVLLFIPSISYGQLPLILLFLFFLMLVFIFKKNYKFSKFILFSFLFLFLYFFYRKLDEGDIKLFTSKLSISNILNYYLTDLTRVKTSIHIAITIFWENLSNNFLQIFLCLFLGIFVIIWGSKEKFKKFRNLSILFLMCIILSLITGGSLSFIVDANQIIMDVVLLIMIFLFIFINELLLINKYNKYFNLVLIIFILYWGFKIFKINNPFKQGVYFELEQYSIDYLKFLEKNKSDFMSSGARYIKTDFGVYGLNSDVDRPGWYLPFLKDGLVVHTINKLDVKDKESLHDFFNFNKKLLLSGNYIFNYFNSNATTNWNQLTEEAKLVFYIKFIRKNNLNYIIEAKDFKIPNDIIALYKDKKTDSLSGETIYFNLIP